MESIRQKVGTGRLSDGDVRAVQAFVDEQMDLMLYEHDISAIVALRQSLVRQKGTAPSQYSLQYVKAVKSGIQNAFEKIKLQSNSTGRFYVQLNLLILAAEMESVEFADFGLNQLNSPDAAIQYWALKTIASPAIADQLSAVGTADEEVKGRIMSALKAAVRKGLYPASLTQVVSFVNAFEDKSAYELLIQIAEQRMKAYESWHVDYELLEADILKALAKKTLTANSVSQKTACAKNYAQLYSYVIQRFILGQDVLDAESKLKLTSVIADVENATIGPEKFLDMSQQGFRQALIKKDLADLQNEHDKLLGSEKRAGRLATDVKFDYGKSSTGDPVTAPKKLPNPVKFD